MVMAVVLGYFLDLILGDPRWLPHPVRAIGWLIVKTEACIRPLCNKTTRGLQIGGAAVTAVVVVISIAVPSGILWLAGMIHSNLQFIIEIWMCYQIFAVKSLNTESMKVHAQLEKGDIIAARKAVSMIVGRDTAQLSSQQVAKAAIETVAENTSDGVIAPCLFMMIGGAPLGFCYKAINTLDSMIGYKNDSYLYFGRAAAKLDDIVNFVPARISAYLMIVASWILGLDSKGAYRIYKRDRYQHASPNSAHTEAVCAGALQIQLAGDAYYFGKLYPKPTIGDRVIEVQTKHIVQANKLMYVTSLLSVIIFALMFFWR